MTFGPVLLGIVLLFLLSIIVALLISIFRNKPADTGLSMLTTFPRAADGTLRCPACGSVSFQTPPSGSRSLFAIALGIFVFGSLSAGADSVAECVACRSRFRRGLAAPQ